MLHDYAKSIAFSKDFDLALKVIEDAKKMKYFSEAKRQFTLLEAQILAESNQYEAALAACNACIDMENGEYFDSEVRFMLMNLLLSEPNYELALQQANEIVKKDLQDPYYYAALYYRPFCNKQLNKMDEARALYKDANIIYRLATLENPAAIDIYLYRAMCLRDLEEYDKALEILDFIAGISNDIAEVHTVRADIFLIQGRKALAEEELEKAYKLKPELRPEEKVGE